MNTEGPLALAESGVSSTDEQIVERVLRGDAALFEVLMRRHNQRVYRAIRGMIRDESEVEDAMQAAWVLAYSNLASFKGRARFSTWLTQVAINEALGRLRNGRRHPAVSLAVVEEPRMSSDLVPPPTPEAQASSRELASLLERAIDSLPELYRVVFVLRELEGMNTGETAVALGVSEDVVKTRMTRARASLRDTLERLVGRAAPEAFGFLGPRCDRVVGTVMRRIAG